jgi:hypothetical protein
VDIYVVDLTECSTWVDVIKAFNVGFVRSARGEWKGNLDAFNDYLSWPDHHYELIVREWQGCWTRLASDLFHDGRPILHTVGEILAENDYGSVVFR